MLDRSEQDRLGAIYGELRDRLLDLTKKNRALNYTFSARSKRQLQIVDEVLEDVYAHLAEGGDSFRVAPLPEPDGTPPEEKTEEFLDALAHAKVSDMEYLAAVDEQAASGVEDEVVLERLERELRDRVREQLGLPPRPRKMEINRDENARSLGIDPSTELPVAGTKDTHSDRLLQTMRYPDELEAIMAKVSDEARLAEQEAGLSTLFLAFGFLEWYDSDSSDKAYYAPLLLLPVNVEKETVRGKPVFEIAAREEAAETNVSLLRFLETQFGRELPEFGESETEGSGSVEDYFARVQESIDGLKRWRIRRWLVLGHFAFSRIAIYEDTKPERWAEPPVGHPLVKALLSGFEDRSGDDGFSFHAPEDYQIDDPVIESIAPVLIQDADASQHSALVDVMKKKNLVIQGPPGTGKSQTITNIIANALSAEKSVLFLAEKQAALDVVKRRLDRAGLGDFCLELHSDRSSPRAVTESLKQRFELGSAPRSRSGPLREDPTWVSSRAKIGEYLEALHAEAEDGLTPFDLIWKSIKGRSEHADFGPGLAGAKIDAELLKDSGRLDELHGQLEIFAANAQSFEVAHGHPALSPWSVTSPGDLPTYELERFMQAVERLQRSVADVVALMADQAVPGLSLPESVDVFGAADEGTMIVAANEALGEPPASETVDSIAGIDPVRLEQALALQEERLAAARAVEALDWPQDFDAAKLASVPALVAALPDGELVSLSPSALRRHAVASIARDRRFLELAEPLRPALTAMGLDSSQSCRSLEAVCVAAGMIAQIVGKVPASNLVWLSADIDADEFGRLHGRWEKHSAEETELRLLSPKYTEDRWPDLAELEAAVAVLRKSFVGKMLGAVSGGNRVATAMAERLGLAADPLLADRLERLANHVRSVAAFTADREARTLLGDGWWGMSTPFREITAGIKLRALVQAKLGEFPDGAEIASTVLSLDPEALAQFCAHAGVASAFRGARNDVADFLEDRSLDDVMSRCRERIDAFTRLLGIDTTDRLSEFDMPLSRLAEIEAATSLLAHTRAAVERSGLAEHLDRLASDDEGIARAREAVSWAKEVTSTDMPSSVSSGLLSSEAGEWRERLRDVAGRYREAFKEFDDAAGDVSEMGSGGMDNFESVRDLSDHLEKLVAAREHLHGFVSLRRARGEMERLGLTDFLAKVDEARFPPARLPGLFLATVAHARAEMARRASDTLGRSSGSALDANRKTFADRDRQKIASDRDQVRNRLLQKQPPDGFNRGSRKTWTEMHLLHNEFPKQKRFTPVRGLMRRASNAVMTLKPCFMMSPLSLSKFLPAGQIEFDLLVIDEASQMKPEDAVGAMLRAKQIVVVGDPKQLPPTSFFDRSGDIPSDDDEDADEIDDESILERCQKVFREVRRLKWHYRSRCESLIRFSNDSFYDGTLITFPAARPDSFSIDLVRVNGEYMARRNVAEAERVVEEAIGFMRRFAEEPEDGMPTLGVVALNTDQRDLIFETFRRMANGDELVELYQEKATKRGEPFFVKNLENVQGDERDYIFISMTYGKERGASRMMQRFGPINSKAGHRRLNVLFSRARTRIGLFTSFGSEDVRPSDNSQEGVRVLKRYLEYAESRGRAVSTGHGGDADSDFEIEVARRLRANGYTVEPQVGVSGFRIDLGIRHPDRPGVFLAGIECDGQRYHSSKSARDRDRLREDVLRDKGWEILRVWSTDWFDNPDGETEKLVKQLESLRKKSASEAEEFVLRSAVPAPTEPEETVEPDLFTPEVDAPTEEPTPAKVEVPEQAEDGVALLNGDGPLTPGQARLALEALRDTVIAPADAGWEPHRSILRDAMIETFVSQGIVDPEDWFNRIPHYLRASTNPSERRLYLETICDVIARIGLSGSTATKPVPENAGSGGLRPEERDTEKPAARSRPVEPGQQGQYSVADPAQAGLEAQRDRFYETGYQPMLRRIVAHVIETEGPIYGDVLAVRVARLHGIARTGGNVQRIIRDAVERRFPRSHEEGREVYWPEGADTSVLVPFRTAPEGVRQYADIPLAELASLALPFRRVGLSDDLIVERMAEHFGLGRIRAAARQRFQAAIGLARSGAIIA